MSSPRVFQPQLRIITLRKMLADPRPATRRTALGGRHTTGRRRTAQRARHSSPSGPTCRGVCRHFVGRDRGLVVGECLGGFGEGVDPVCAVFGHPVGQLNLQAEAVMVFIFLNLSIKFASPLQISQTSRSNDCGYSSAQPPGRTQ